MMPFEAFGTDIKKPADPEVKSVAAKPVQRNLAGKRYFSARPMLSWLGFDLRKTQG